MKTFIAATFSLILMTGCANLSSASSGYIGCPENEIQILNDHMGLNTRTWTASCRGKVFYCSAISGGNGQESVFCKEEIESK